MLKTKGFISLDQNGNVLSNKIYKKSGTAKAVATRMSRQQQAAEKEQCMLDCFEVLRRNENCSNQ